MGKKIGQFFSTLDLYQQLISLRRDRPASRHAENAPLGFPALLWCGARCARDTDCQEWQAGFPEAEQRTR